MQWASCRNQPYRLPSQVVVEACSSECNMVVSDYRRRVCGIDTNALAAEQVVVDWFSRLHFVDFGCFHGEFVSGSSEAILTVLWRCRSFAKASGLDLEVYGTAFTHYSVLRSCKMLSVAYHEVRSDEFGRISFRCLQECLSRRVQEQSLAVVILTIGLSSTGESDDLNMVCGLKSAIPKLIVHVDGAIGGLSARFLLDGLPMMDTCGVDSISCDLHKSGLCCYGSGVLCMRKELYEAAGSRVPAFSDCFDYGILGSRSSIQPVLAAEVIRRMKLRWRAMFKRQLKMRDEFVMRLSSCETVSVYSCPCAVPMVTLSVESPSAREKIESAFSTPFYGMPSKSNEPKFCRLFFNRQNNLKSVLSAADMIRNMV